MIITCDLFALDSRHTHHNLVLKQTEGSRGGERGKYGDWEKGMEGGRGGGGGAGASSHVIITFMV